LAPGERASFSVELAATQTIDRASVTPN